ncbi:MAG TPA: monovalent cation:proton antiporter-2 (CPA2) family protein [Gemmatimonadales bacterium]|nr:monovalent cation:proton antiporter-2 (CPA2) family protein [Gemmatimonadales bacterium]
MTEPAGLRDLLFILLAAVVVVPLFRRLHASAVLGYLVAGTLIGPFGLGLIREVEAVAGLAQFGVVFLLFSIGLSLSIERLTSLRRFVFGLGIAQVLVTALVLWSLLRLLGLESPVALVLGGGLALSSTAVVLQVLIERRELATPRGRVAFSVLLLQDLAVVPLLTLVPLLRGPEARVLPALGLAFVKAAVALVLILAVGRLLLRPLLRTVTRGGNPELFTGIVLLLVLGIGWLTEQAGLSMALGAFLAGVLIAETEYRPQVEGDIQPFSGILLALFFMTVGMGVDIALVWHQAPLLLALLVGLLLVKAGILLGLARAFRLGTATAAAVGLMLAQGGEFGFVLFALARQAEVLPAPIAQVAVLVVGLSMAVTPLLLAASRRVAHRLERTATSHATLAGDAGELRDHVLIAGYGRVGQTLALLLASRGTDYVALDLDPERVAEARRRDLPVFFGDASRADVLKAAAVERAQAVVITVDEPEAASHTTQLVRMLAPEVPVLARARDLAQCEALTRAGATAVVPEVVEGSLQLVAALLRQLGVSREEVDQNLAEFRRETYARLAGLSEPAG